MFKIILPKNLLINLIGIYASALPILAASNDKTVLQEPEDEIKMALTNLDNLAWQVNAFAKISGDYRMLQSTVLSDDSYEMASSLYTKKEYKAVIAYLNIYLNSLQTLDTIRYQRAQLMLARSYEALGQKKKAIRSYVRYIASNITRPHDDEFELDEVGRHLLELSGYNTKNKDRELGKLLLDLTNMELPKLLGQKVRFYIALFAAENREVKMALEWLIKIAANTRDDRLRARSFYQLGLLELKQNKYGKAKEYFKKCAKVENEGINDIRNLANLALARIAVFEKKANIAIKHYLKVDSNSDAYAEGLFELTYVYLDIKDYQKALGSSKNFLKRFEKNRLTPNIKILMSYLYLKAGQLSHAKGMISNSTNELKNIQLSLKKILAQPKIELNDIEKIAELLNHEVFMAPLLEEAKEFFHMISSLKGRLFDLRDDVSHIIYSLAQKSFDQLKPQISYKNKQLDSYMQNALEIGRRLIAVEKRLYLKELKKDELIELDAFEKRRFVSLKEPLITRRKVGNYREWTNLAKLNIAMAKRHEQLKKQQAILANLLFLMKSSAIGFSSHRGRYLMDLQQKSVMLEKKLNRAIEIIKSRQIRAVYDRNPVIVFKEFVIEYVHLIHEEQAILEKYRDRPSTIVARYLAQEINRAWRKWDFVIKDLYTQIDALNKQIISESNELLQNLDGMVQRCKDYNHRLQMAKVELQNVLKDHVGLIMNHYYHQIINRIAKHKKWESDIDWLSHKIFENKKLDIAQKYDVERQLLDQNLKDLQQGALLRWQE